MQNTERAGISSGLLPAPREETRERTWFGTVGGVNR
jgi:hypothetical protein